MGISPIASALMETVSKIESVFKDRTCENVIPYDALPKRFIEFQIGSRDSLLVEEHIFRVI